MKILYFALVRFPNHNAAANRIINNAKLMKKLGHEIKLFGFVDRIYEDESGVFDGVYFKNQAMKKGILRFPRKKTVRNIIKKENPSTIIFYNFPSWIQIGLLKYCKRKKVKIIGDITEWYTKLYGNSLFKLIKTIDVSLRMNYLNKKLDGLIVISSLLYKKYPNNKKILLPPLVDIKQDVWLQKINEKKNKFHFLYNGETSNNKDRLQDIFNALEIVKKQNIDFNFFIAGVTEKSVSNLSLTISADIQNSVIFLGFIPHSESIKLLLEADVSIIPRVSNTKTNAGFPTKFVEAITAGTYVLVTDISDVKNFITPSNGLIISLESIASSLIEYVKNNNYKTIENKTEIVETFDYRNYEQELKEFLKEVNE